VGQLLPTEIPDNVGITDGKKPTDGKAVISPIQHSFSGYLTVPLVA
jgi:hypothetical protein